MLPFKILHNNSRFFYFSKNKDRFWVRDLMHSMQQSISKQCDEQPYLLYNVLHKATQNTLQKSQLF
jgi:hypothetical protein